MDIASPEASARSFPQRHCEGCQERARPYLEQPLARDGSGRIEEQIRRLHQEKSDEVSVLEVGDYGKFLKVNRSNLEYKKQGMHYSKVRERECLFYDSAADSHVSNAGSRGLEWFARLLPDRLTRRL
jgi:hypothetical protein